jgi:hypothetical protein
MAFPPSQVYQLTGDRLGELCATVGVDSGGTVRVLRRRLVEFLRADVDTVCEEPTMDQATQADVKGGIVNPPAETQSQVGGVDNGVPVLVELLRKVPPQTASEPEEILRLFIKLDDIYKLRLVNDRVFITQILPLVAGDMLSFLGECLREGSTWEQCKVLLRRRVFSHFVRERLVRDLIVCKIQGEREPLREHINHVFSTADFLG